jgi:hypothetical protein
MSTPLLDRFQSWLGRWRGTTEHHDGRKVMAEFTFTPYFNGEMIQLDVLVIDPETGQAINGGVGMLALDERGRAVDVIASERLGHAVLRENPDEPEVLSLSGQLAGNLEYVITFRREGDELHYNSRSIEGYAAPETKARYVTVLKRVNGGAA